MYFAWQPLQRRSKNTSILLIIPNFSLLPTRLILFDCFHEDNILDISRNSERGRNSVVCKTPTNPKDEEDIRNVTLSPYKINSSINKCLYITSENFLTKLSSETFAHEEVCTMGLERRHVKLIKINRKVAISARNAQTEANVDQESLLFHR
ncbi:unnamed protein product [Mytilus coruscus]|uniref:Uncharacterized protein n=1 Tax=Mytilus coruscus TaxID=42192 RepID=A0A6J8DHM4_MYTCO|nr:unnamed protein product [Mytilus coruscus]